jgi:peptidoglycan-associated lipoprotein
MKKTNLFGMFLLSLALATGCARTPTVTPIPNRNPQTPPAQPSTSGHDANNGNNAVSPGIPEPTPAPPQATGEPIPQTYGPFADTFATGNQDREKFKADTIHFDFDSSVIKSSEDANLQHVADYFKDNKKGECLIIEGNCDERGTEKYNLSLGERRALAAREYLANLGVDPQRLKTVTYGASRPVDSGHDESAWKQNRRDEFILVTPK